jgi:hypothetical protein
MKYWFLYLMISCFISCKDFNFEKESAEEILKQELKSINWQEVDFYPTFQTCETVTSKQESKTCFETEVKASVYNRLSQEEIITFNQEQDTVILELSISKKGEATMDVLKIPEGISSNNPQLNLWLKEAIDNLPELYPAQKRGVPVALRTQLPILLE